MENLAVVQKKMAGWGFDRQKITHCLATGLMILLAAVAVTANASDKERIPGSVRGIVVLDPGHGGNDLGVKGPDGTYEKVVTLAMARIISDQLSKDGYKVVLTRMDDYGVDIADRAAKANHAKADLFISLHAGGSFLYNVSGASVFFFKKSSAPALKFKKSTYAALDEEDLPIPWNRLQDKYLSGSMKLAEMMLAQILKITQDPNSTVRGAEILVLEGADMPAVLIEFGYLTNPNESKAFSDRDFMALLANAMSKAVKTFLSKQDQ
jgi:N-acetylmuramoyl-L-alanine amidase